MKTILDSRYWTLDKILKKWAEFIFVFFLASIIQYPASSYGAFGKKAVGTTGAQFLKLGVNARAIGMGEAYSAVCDGSDAVYWNPATLYRVEKSALSVMHAVYLQNIYYDYASYAQRAGFLGTFGIGIQYLNGGSLNRTDEFGTDIGTFNPYDFALTVGWAKQFKELGDDEDEGSIGEFLFGVSGKFIQSKIVETANTGAADIGIAWNPIEKFWLAIGVQNIGAELKYKNQGDPLPLNVKLGSSYALYKYLLLACDLNFPNDNNPNVSFGTEIQKSIGTETKIFGRTGYSSRNTGDIDGISSISIGAGLGWKEYGIDFAWVPFGSLGNSYRISLSAKF